MLRICSSIFLAVMLSSCGIDTSSSPLDSALTDSNTTTDGVGLIDLNPTTDIVDDSTMSGVDLIDPNPVVSGVDLNISTDNTTTTDSNTSDVTVADQADSVFDVNGAIEDEFACLVGDINDGYTNRTIVDDSFDYLGTFDEEHGIGVNSRMTYNDDIDKTKITVFYYDLKPARAMDLVSVYETQYRLDIDRAWAYNEEKVVYVKTPIDANGLYGCYRYDLSSLDVDSTLTGTKVYRKKL